MIRVSDGKYRVGDNLTLIFVRVSTAQLRVRLLLLLYERSCIGVLAYRPLSAFKH